MWKLLLDIIRPKGRDSKLSSQAGPVDELEPGSGRVEQPPIQLVIGLDFGTSFTKVVVGESRTRYPVPFHAYAFQGNPYLLPSSLCLSSESDECALGTEVEKGTCYDNLKMPLIDRDFTHEHQVRAAAFLALVLRHTREWLLDTHASVYGHRKINWYINVGLPTDSYDDAELISAYRSIVRAAWLVGTSRHPVALAEVSSVLESDDSEIKALTELTEQTLPADRVNLFPEFSAQVAAYVQSPRRREGLHAMVDVGGGTLDVTVFNIHDQEGELVFPIFARKVQRLGTRYLMRSRLKAQPENTQVGFSPFDDLPIEEWFCEKTGLAESELRTVDDLFRKCVEDVISEQLRYTKVNRAPRAPHWFRDSPPAPEYGQGLPSFFCGGGALSTFYSSVLYGFEEADLPLRLKALELPVPDSLESSDFSPSAYPRMNVAYGLSFDPFDIGQIRRMSEVPDDRLEATGSNMRERYVSKDQM